jgi:hypothetical protein
MLELKRLALKPKRELKRFAPPFSFGFYAGTVNKADYN